MWRSLFLALGIFLIIIGGETLVVDKYLMSDGRKLPKLVQQNPNQAPNSAFQQVGYPGYSSTNAVQAPTIKPNRVVQTKDWMPWSLLATGTIIVLYTYSLPRRYQSRD
jgi:hypothetical protein